MLLWVGLGNPQPEYERTRHNVGFMAVDAIAQRYLFPRKWSSTFFADAFAGFIANRATCVLKPVTCMNCSGFAVNDFCDRAEQNQLVIPNRNIAVFHDDLDLPCGTVRVQFGGGDAGHLGVRSITEHLGTPDYWRVRIGIGHPGSRDLVLDYVLGEFTEADHKWLAPTLTAITDASPRIVSGERFNLTRHAFCD